jgi:HK97 family phage major capsid protein
MRSNSQIASLSTASHDFVRVAKCLAAGRGRADEVSRWARSIPSTRVREILKAGVVPNSLTDAGALAPYRELATGFFGSMAAQSAFAKIFGAGDFTRTPLRTLIAVLTTAPVAYSVSELAPKPITSLNFATAQLEAEKVSAHVVITNELARSLSPAATSRLGEELRRAASIAVDAKFLALMAATPGITTAASTGVTASAILSDLTGRINAMTTLGADSRLWAIVGPKLYKTMSLVQGTGGYIVQNGTIGPIKLAVSDAASTVLTLIDSKQICAELDFVTIDSTREASLQMEDTPSSGEQTAVSLWQNNMTGLKCEISFGAIATRSTAVTTITGYAA